MRKKLLILSSNGGSGHHAAAMTLQGLLKNAYAIKVVHPINDLKIFGVPSGESLYNYVLKKGWLQLMNLIITYIAPWLFRSRKNKIERLIGRYIEEEKPDYIVSLIPFINFPATEAARKKKIPYLLITTDNDLRNWIHDLDLVTHPQFKVTVGFDLPSTTGLLKTKKISEKLIEHTGFPLRSDFLENKNIQLLARKYLVPNKKFVVCIMMGGAGGYNTLKYAEEVGKLALNLHLVVCIGKNQKVASHLSQVKLHPENSMTIVPFTEHIADWMALADLIITKPGPGTINEAMAMKVPVLIDAIDPPLVWERANIDLVIRYGIGDSITRPEDIGFFVKRYLTQKNRDKNYSNQFPLNNFHNNIENILKSITS